MRYVTDTKLGDWKFTQMRPSEMMNTSHNNISDINQKQDRRKSEIHRVDRNPTFPPCRLGKRHQRQERQMGRATKTGDHKIQRWWWAFNGVIIIAKTGIKWVPSCPSCCSLVCVSG